jgi:hypothetical protein
MNSSATTLQNKGAGKKNKKETRKRKAKIIWNSHLTYM